VELTVIIGWFIALFGAVILVQLIFTERLFRHLARHHRKVYLRLGAPTIWFGNRRANADIIERFLQNDKYLRLKDPEVDRLVRRIRASQKAVVVAAVTAVTGAGVASC
jgi:hypothetical protein